MPYAINGQVSQDPLEGGIVITEEQYALAIDGMTSGLVVTITSGFDVSPAIQEPEMEPDPLPVDPATAAVIEYARLRARADYEIPPLQDAVDIDEATAAEVALLKAWKKYRVELNRVTEQAGYPQIIDWPQAPAS